MNAQLLADLQKMKALFAKDGTWTQGENARSKAGRKVEALGKNAVCFCLIGAAQYVTRRNFSARTSAVDDAVVHAIGVVDKYDVVDWNDAPARTIADVRCVIDAAIERAAA